MSSFLSTVALSSTSWQPEDWDKVGYNLTTFKKKRIELFSLQRPHMRAFHLAWFAFFGCFIVWFAIPPLMGTIRKPRCLPADNKICIECLQRPEPLGRRAEGGGSVWAKDADCKKCFPNDTRLGAGCGGLGLTKDQILVSNIVSVSGTMIMRILIGPFGDTYGTRRTYAALLVIMSVPGFLAAAMDSFGVLVLLRVLISFAGGSFVLTSLWTTAMFDSNCVGTANATTAGWGNLGGGVALEVMPLIFKGFVDSGYSTEKAWRTTLALPPVLLVVSGVLILFFSDDCPLGDIRHLHAHKAAEREKEKQLALAGGETVAEGKAVSMLGSMYIAAQNWRTWIAALCYAFSFGAELTVNNNMPAYFQKGFSLNQHNAVCMHACVFVYVGLCVCVCVCVCMHVCMYVTVGGLEGDTFYPFYKKP